MSAELVATDGSPLTTSLSPSHRTIWDRRAERGLRAPGEHLRSEAWSRFHVLAINEGRSAYDPWPSFAKAHYSPAEIVLVSGAERVGKSLATAAEAFCWIPVSKLIWVVGPQYRDTEKEMAYLAEACLNAGLTDGAHFALREDKSSYIVVIDKNDIDPVTKKPREICEIRTRSLWDIERALVAEAPDLICVVEAGLVQRDPLEKLQLRVSTMRGRVWLSGTLETASPWFDSAYSRWQSWPNDENGFAISVPLYENAQDFPGGRDNPEITHMRKTFRPATYSHRVEGKPAPSDLLVFRDTFVRGEHPIVRREMPFVRLTNERNRVPVEIAIDPGRRRPSWYTVHFVQWQGPDICVVGEVALQESYHEEVIQACRRHPCWENVVGGVMDPWAARQHGLGYAKSPWQIWYDELGWELRLPEPAPSPEQVIDRYWYYIRHPSGECRFFYDPVRCPHLDWEWRRWKYPRNLDGSPNKLDPQKKNCDGIKGVGYLLVDWFAQRAFAQPQRTRALGKERSWTFR